MIEAVRKLAHFHNHGLDVGVGVEKKVRRFGKKRRYHKKDNTIFISTIEDAAKFYFTEDFANSQIRGALTNLFNLLNVPDHIDDLPSFLVFGGDNAIEEMGAFMRALSSYYLLRDCERLVNETITRISLDADVGLSALHCKFNLDQVKSVLKGAQAEPIPYKDVARLVLPERPRAVY